MQGIGKWLERDTEGKTQGAPETKKEGLTNLISCREKKWLQKGIDVINVLISTRLHTASDANKHRQEIIELGAQNSCFNPHMRGLTASEKTDVSTGAIAALEPGCADTLLLFHVRPSRGDRFFHGDNVFPILTSAHEILRDPPNPNHLFSQLQN